MHTSLGVPITSEHRLDDLVILDPIRVAVFRAMQLFHVQPTQLYPCDRFLEAW